MSRQLISRSPDLQRLVADGYDVEIKDGYLLVKDVPYVSATVEIRRGVLVSKLDVAGDVTTPPGDHTAFFVGDHPCHRNGSKLVQIEHSSNRQQLADGLAVDHLFSAKPASGAYPDYYVKMTTYVAIIASPAQSIDPTVTAMTFPVLESEKEDSVFRYIDTASSRAGTGAVTSKLELRRVAIVGLGGTGSYVLDLIAKTPVREIHLFDGDRFLQHNAFRSPGAPSIDELRQAPQKVTFFADRYSAMRRGIVPHDCNVDDSNVDLLHDMDFVFLCLDRGAAKMLLVQKLEEFDLPFVDVGMGVQEVDGALLGILRVTTSTRERRDHVRAGRIPFSDGDINNEYSRNIQIADLNALNAALAVIRWKKLFGFYLDLDREHHSTYTIDGNILTNDDRP
jgi:hypothetical protein